MLLKQALDEPRPSGAQLVSPYSKQSNKPCQCLEQAAGQQLQQLLLQKQVPTPELETVCAPV